MLVFTSHVIAICPLRPFVPFSDMRSFALPAKVRTPFCPGVDIVAVTEPPAVMLEVKSAGTE